MSTTPSPAAAPPPRKQGSNLVLWGLGLLLAAIVILGGGAFVAARLLVKNVEVRQADSSLEINTPMGTLKAGTVAATDPGLPVYPGSRLSEPAGTVELTGTNEETVAITAAHYRTADTAEKVDTWYREHLSASFRREGPGVMVLKKHIAGIEVRSEDVAYVEETDEVVRVVAIQKRIGGVEVSLLRIGKKEAQ